jgi:tetratricopeptide (TPR) repeat protein
LSGAGYYARKLVQPFPLNFGIVEVPGGYFWVGCLLILLLGLLFWRLSWAGSFILTAVSLASVALLVAMGNVSWTPYAERYMYGPSAMLAIGGGLAAGQNFRRFDHYILRSYATWTVAFLLLIGFVVVFQRGMVWQDNLTLFADTVKKSPDFALAHNQLADALWNRGRNAEALEIVRHLDVPESQVAFINRVLIFMDEGRYEEARAFLLENLNNRSTQGYHTAILERLIEVVEQLRTRSVSPEQNAAYDDEVIGYLHELWRRTHKPFYLYRLGQKQLFRGDAAAARESFVLAYAKLPADSIYREPSRKLAESLKEK